MSLPQNVILLARDVYQIGDHPAPIQSVPAGATTLTLAVQMDTADQENSAYSLTVQVQTSTDNGQTYGGISSYEWMGGIQGPNDKNPGQPNPFFYEQSLNGATDVKISISSPQQLSFELDGTLS